MLRMKCIYHGIDPEDGLRVFITSRLTDDDGYSAIREWAKAERFHSWNPLLAPPPAAVHAYLRERISLETLCQRYRAHLETSLAENEARSFAERGCTEDITFLCLEPNPARGTLPVLVRKCALLVPEVKIYVPSVLAEQERP